LTLAIYDEKETAISEYSSEAKPAELLPPNAPDYWFAPPTVLTKAAGVNRFVSRLEKPLLLQPLLSGWFQSSGISRHSDAFGNSCSAAGESEKPLRTNHSITCDDLTHEKPYWNYEDIGVFFLILVLIGYLLRLFV
jgi:hypothetical protein